MSNEAKINIGAEELSIMLDREFLEMKFHLSDKIISLFNQFQKELHPQVMKMVPNLPEGIISSSGKISKGENYLKLPYIVLDYPRLFSRDSIFAFRTMFRWGHEFSFTLHLQGSALEKYKENILKNFSKPDPENTFICVNENPWHFHFGKDNYILLRELKSEREFHEMLISKGFLKLSRKISLEKWAMLNKEGIAFFEEVSAMTGLL